MLENPSNQKKQAHHIPSDLRENIMSMVPVKSLLRFRSVSKTWRSLIDESREFHRRHLCSFNKTQQQKLHILKDGPCHRKSVVAVSTKTFDKLGNSVDLKFNEPVKCKLGWCIMCAVDGLYMLQNIGREFEFLLWNPSIRKYRILPPPPPQPPSVKVIVSDIGLGFDPLTKDYKYVGFARQHCGDLSSVWIYSLGTNSWKPNSLKPNGCPEFYGHRVDSKVCFAGVLYSLQVMLAGRLASYDLSTDKFCSAHLPCKGDGGSYCHSLTLSNDGTCLVLASIIVDQQKGTIWLSEELGGQDSMHISWTKAYTFASKIPESHPFDGYMRFLHLNDEDTELLLSWNGKFLTSYNLKTQHEKMLSKSEVPMFDNEVHPYVESLLLLN